MRNFNSFSEETQEISELTSEEKNKLKELFNKRTSSYKDRVTPKIEPVEVRKGLSKN